MIRNDGSTSVAVAIIVLLLLGGGAYLLSTRGVGEQPAAGKKEESAPLSESSLQGGKEVMTEQSGLFAGALLAGSAAPLLDFVQSDYEQAKASGKLVVLYFYANWCPICKVEVADALYPAFNELVREDVIGFRVNYNDSDTDADEKALARGFGVGYQHTKVFLKEGKRILKSPEEWDRARYITEINTALNNNL